jgi:hypothetical protein
MNSATVSSLRPLKPEDRSCIEEYLRYNRTLLSSYNFASIFVWSDLLETYWTVIDDNLCIFEKAHDAVFMPIPPIGVSVSKNAIAGSFSLMNRTNQNPALSRIEDVDSSYLSVFHSLGLGSLPKDEEYICRTDDIANLSGNRYKGKRSTCNYFVKNYVPTYLPFKSSNTQECMHLFDGWAEMKSRTNEDSYYQTLLQHARNAHHTAMTQHDAIGLTGRIVKVGGKICAYTFGFPLTGCQRGTGRCFCIMFEVSDLSIKGAAQYIFREFCREMLDYEYINIMGSSGLDNLRKIKLSYHPVLRVPSFQITNAPDYPSQG